MAPMRRRLSKRVVKSTFQECFEYDLPGHRVAEPKRVSLLEGRTRISEKTKQEVKVEKVVHDKNSNQVPKTKAPTTKVSSKDDVSKKRGSENVKVKGKESVKIKSNEVSKTQGISKKLANKTSAKLLKIKKSAASRLKTKNAFLGSDYKRFKSPQIKAKTRSKTISNAQKLEENMKDDGNKADTKTGSGVPKNIPSSTKKDLGSTNWQPVVHLEKIRFGGPKALGSGGKGKEMSSSYQQLRSSSSRSPDLATRLRNALKDPLAEREDESAMTDNGISNSMLVEEVVAGALPHAGPSLLLDSEDCVYGGKRNLKNSALERVFRGDVSPQKPGSDSALEDWPESSSEHSEDEDAVTKENNFVLDDSSISDWSAPHVKVILHWQNKFNRVTNELTNSFDSLKSIIEEKNSLIAALKNKLDSFNDSTCHKILDRILLDYDKHDTKKPATLIINSILEY